MRKAQAFFLFLKLRKTIRPHIYHVVPSPAYKFSISFLLNPYTHANDTETPGQLLDCLFTRLLAPLSARHSDRCGLQTQFAEYIDGLFIVFNNHTLHPLNMNQQVLMKIYFMV